MREIKRANTLFYLTALLLLVSCVPQANRIIASSSEDSTDESPYFSSTLNYWSNGTTTSFSTLTIYTNFSSTLAIHGVDVDDYIRNNNRYTPECFATKYPDSYENKYLVFAAFPATTTSSNGATEYYYRLDPNAQDSNIGFCQTAGVINKLNTLQPGYTIAYSADSLCSTCTYNQMQGSDSLFLTSAGISISTIGASYLTIDLKVASSTSTGSTVGCSSSSYCIALGYDCCSDDNQCINAGTLKSDAADNDDYPYALADVLNNPENYINWPSVYNVCPVTVVATPTATPDVDQDVVFDDHLQRLKELYECTTPQHAEVSICTKNYEDVTDNELTTFVTGSDDRNFKNTYSGDPLSYDPDIIALPDHSIEEIIYAGIYLYKDREFTDAGTIQITGGNDSIASTDYVTLSNLSYTPSSSAPNDTLKVRYKVDGSCTQVSDSIAKCYKIYVQGQNIAEVDDHYPSSKEFLIPRYANLSKTLKVEVNDEFTTKWTLNEGTDSYVEFDNDIYDGQEVKITYYVDTSDGLNQVLKSKLEALNEIDEMCDCGGPYCTLNPQTDDDGEVINYTCVYPETDTTEAPQYQEIYISSKSVPHRLFDESGTSKEEMDSSITQEGTEFLYTDDNLLKPNNVDNKIGFNEIYGSFTMASNSAVPATEVRVEAGTTYDLYTNSGNFSSCLNCGTDYYSNLVRLFPDNFTYSGGGYRPDSTSTNRSSLGSSYPYRADDLIFGRACWLPVTMIPWSHQDFADSQYQRLKRLETQHFYFANGYQRDWYGFDYGAVIGSFDGVFWFGLGGKRRITATTNRLYIAINAYFADLTTKSSYHITIQDASLNPTLGTEVTSDYENDGAQCRQYHVCSSDSDCVAKLGWDYMCETITGVKSLWPEFDSSANELPEINDNLLSIFSRIGSSLGGTKRCVYRGRGAPCHKNYLGYSDQPENTYARSGKPRVLGCAQNHYCADIEDEKFNDRINRYGYSVSYVNGMNGREEHTFGKGAPLIGRPQNFNGDKEITSDIKSNLNANNVEGICIPGRNPDAVYVSNSNTDEPLVKNSGDQVIGIGMTPSTLSNTDPRYINSCSVLDTDGNFVLYKTSVISASTSLENDDILQLAGAQILPANALSIFQENSDDVFGDYHILDNFLEDQITKAIIQENSCLRAPGSVCHTDLDCAPSELITKMTSQIDDGITYMNPYELKFWQETLVCGQADYKTIDGDVNEDYDLTYNRCCRETGNTLTIGSQESKAGTAYGTDLTQQDSTNFSSDPTNILGATIALDDTTRYSRLSTASYLMQTKEDDYPQLRFLTADANPKADYSILERQYNTFTHIASNTCCSANWIRNFNKEDNGGGHTWGPEKMQNLDKSNFKCVNWLPCTYSTDSEENSCGETRFTCDHTEGDANDERCLVRDITTSESKKVFAFMNSLEMLGIPQVKVPSTDFTETWCKSAPETQGSVADGVPIPETIISDPAAAEYGTSTEDRYFSAVDDGNFESDLKMVFSPDEITCCVPAGEEPPDDSDDDVCCTGYINPSTGLCALKDYSNVSVYFNRYVSSAANGLSASLFDEETGFIKDPDVVIQLACSLNVCRDGAVAKGISHSRITVPGAEDPLDENRKKNFIDRNNLDCSYSDYYDAGLRWNTDIYCVPADVVNLSDNDDCDFEAYSCSSLE